MLAPPLPPPAPPRDGDELEEEVGSGDSEPDEDDEDDEDGASASSASNTASGASVDKVLSASIVSPALRCNMMHTERQVVRLAAGAWRMDLWLPFEDAVLPRLSGVLIRRVRAELSCGRRALGQVTAASTRHREKVRFSLQASAEVVLLFSSKALAPMVFRYALIREDDVEDPTGTGKTTDSALVFPGAEDLVSGAGAGAAGAEDASTEDASTVGRLVAFSTASDVTQGGPERYSLDWMEQRYRRLPFDDKLRIAQVLIRAQEAGWPSLDGASAHTFDNRLGIAEMRRASALKNKAFRKGLIRPFLLLVSMHPARRLAWSYMLGLNLARDQRLEDSHWTTWRILTHPRKGIVSRASRTYREQLNPFSRKMDWYQIVYRVLCVLSRDRAELKDLRAARLDKDASKAETHGAVPAENTRYVEEAYAVRFYSLRAHAALDGDLDKGTVKVPLDGAVHEVSVEQIKAATIEIVADDPEFAAAAQRLRANTGMEDPSAVAMAVLNSFCRHAAPVVASHEVEQLAHETNKLELEQRVKQREDNAKLDNWSSQWGSQAFAYNEEFKELVAKRVKHEKARTNARAGVGAVIPIIVASITVHPGVAVIMVSRAAVQRALPLAPASLAAIIAGLIVQRNWLAIGNDVNLESFYPREEELATT
jgi:hypothetical protein